MFIISVLVPTERKYVRKHQSISIFKIVTLTGVLRNHHFKVLRISGRYFKSVVKQSDINDTVNKLVHIIFLQSEKKSRNQSLLLTNLNLLTPPVNWCIACTC